MISVAHLFAEKMIDLTLKSEFYMETTSIDWRLNIYIVFYNNKQTYSLKQFIDLTRNSKSIKMISFTFSVETKCIPEDWKKWVFNLASTAVILSEHLPRPGIRTLDLPALSPKVLSISPQRWFLKTIIISRCNHISIKISKQSCSIFHRNDRR